MCRVPHGTRGLKSIKRITQLASIGRVPHGTRGLKFVAVICDLVVHTGRVPHGTRGLKCQFHQDTRSRFQSRPAWDAWIEMQNYRRRYGEYMSRPAWDAWIEISYTKS